MKWENPPPPNSGYEWSDIAQALQNNPNDWLRVFEEGPVSIANAIRQSSIMALTPVVRPGRGGGFEVRTRNNKVGPPRVCSLYLRWVPPLEGS
jgi:hypothetical protein